MTQRIHSIDMLRGFALLGILIMNIISFSMPAIAYFNPKVYQLSFLDEFVFGFSHVLADQKFMAIFSMLFGASTILFIEGATKKGKRAGLLFYSRNFWLLLVGILHTTFIWYGDILLIYAICAFVLFFFKKLNIKPLIILGLFIYLIPIIFNVFIYTSVLEKLNKKEKTTIQNHWQPNEEVLRDEILVYQSSYTEMLQYTLEDEGNNGDEKNMGSLIIGLHYMFDFFLRALGMMLIGMAFYKKKVFSNSKKKSYYKKMGVYSFAIGIPIAVIGLFLNYHYNWEWEFSFLLGRLLNSVATPFIAFGYIGLVMLWNRSNLFRTFQKRLQELGKIALSGYLLQSVLATTIFYGFGFGLFGEINRAEQLLFVVLIWVFILFFAQFWTNKFQYGPVEWIWRTLTYFTKIPLIKKQHN